MFLSLEDRLAGEVEFALNFELKSTIDSKIVDPANSWREGRTSIDGILLFPFQKYLKILFFKILWLFVLFAYLAMK